jgi:hypothetical protein
VKYAMSVRREERYTTAGAFHEALRAAFAGQPAPQPGEATTVARPSRELGPPPPQVVKLNGKASEFDEPMTMPAIDVSFARKPPAHESPSGSGPPTMPPATERTVVTEVGLPAKGPGHDERTALTDFRPQPAPRPTRLAAGSDPTGTVSAAAGTDPGLRSEATLAADLGDNTLTPGSGQIVTAPGRPRNKEQQRDKEQSGRSARSTVVDEETPFLPDLPPWATPWVLAAVGAGLVLIGFLLGLALR